MLIKILQDALFSAIAAIGFSAISNPPVRSYAYCAFIAAVGHSLRFVLMQPGVCGLHIVPATALAALVIGLLAVFLSKRSTVPPETYIFPSLLPMVPGVYAYKAFGGLAMCLFFSDEPSFVHNFYLFASNGMMAFFILLAMAVGAVIPIFMFKQVSFQATRR